MLGVPLGSSKSWFRLPFVYRPRAERRESPALAAFHWNGSIPRVSRVVNISSSGAYLLTSEPWTAGEILSLSLQRSGALETANQRHFTVQAKAIRRDREGVGVQFLMPRGAELRLWQSAIKSQVPQTEPEDVVREFRLAAALAFIQRLSPCAADQARLLMRRGLSNFRLESAIEIALHAEELLAFEGSGEKLEADPAVVLRILEDGSWAESDWIQHYWAGLLAISCASGESAQSHLKLVSLLSQLTTIQARIFAGSCQLADKTVDRNGEVSVLPLTCSSAKLIEIADTHDRVHIERDIQHLTELGLVEKSVKWKFFSLLDQAVITPTALSLELYARCHGHGGGVGEFFAKYSDVQAIAAD
jgi:hypothetical protein